jgi:hypothetical protein
MSTPQSAPDHAGSLPGETVPRPLLLAAAIVGVESLIGIGYGVYLLIAAFVGTPREFGQAVAVGVTITLLAAPLPWVARGLSRAKMWSRTPAVMLQLLGLWFAYYMVQGGFYAGAVPTVVATVAGLVVIFLPSSTAALTRHWRED